MQHYQDLLEAFDIAVVTVPGLIDHVQLVEGCLMEDRRQVALVRAGLDDEDAAWAVDWLIQAASEPSAS